MISIENVIESSRYDQAVNYQSSQYFQELTIWNP